MFASYSFNYAVRTPKKTLWISCIMVSERVLNNLYCLDNTNNWLAIDIGVTVMVNL
jgi:hypothetical protein